MTTPPPEPSTPPEYGSPPPPPSPPPGGGYGAPPPPPPGGGYGAPPPPPPSGGYGAPPGAGPEPGLGEALSYSWAKFQQHVAAILTAMVVYLVIAAVIGGIGFGFLSLVGRTGSGGFGASLVIGALQAIVFSFIGILVQAGFIRGALAIVRGETPTLATFFSTDNLAQVLVAAVLVSVATGIGTLLCYLPGLVIGFLTTYTLFFVIDKNVPAVDAVKASVQFTIAHLGTLLVYAGVGGIIVFVATLLCILPVLVAAPVVLLGQTFLFKRLQGDTVAA